MNVPISAVVHIKILELFLKFILFQICSERIMLPVPEGGSPQSFPVMHVSHCVTYIASLQCVRFVTLITEWTMFVKLARV
jgi:hypothetical protein